MSPRCMETNRNIVANAETGVPAEDFAERVRVNQAKPTSEQPRILYSAEFSILVPTSVKFSIFLHKSVN